jgi:hypothetical protein
MLGKLGVGAREDLGEKRNEDYSVVIMYRALLHSLFYIIISSALMCR